MTGYNYSFTPRSVPGAKNPPQLNKLCHGVNLSNLSDEDIWKKGVNLTYIIDAYRNLNMGDHFFRPFFELLIGTDYVRKMMERGCREIQSTAKALSTLSRQLINS